MTLFFISCSHPDNENYDGVNLAQQEILHAMKRKQTSNITFLTEDALLYPEHMVSLITSNDTVYCNVDPYASLIYLAREEAGLDFRIGRNVQTGPWNGYLLQEWLCGPLTRSRDLVFYISHYAEHAFRNWLPEAEFLGHHIVCYPEVFCYPKASTVVQQKDRPYSAAYIGRLSYDKGFDVVMKSFAKMHEADQSMQFRAIGTVHQEDYSKSEWSEVVHWGESIGVRFSPPLSRAAVFTELQKCGTLIFPSTSNVESLGRVVLEACHCGTPVVAAAHAEVPLMLESAALVPPEYILGLEQSTATHFAMGKPSPDYIAESVLRGVPLVPPEVLDNRNAHWRRYCRLLLTPDQENEDVRDSAEITLPPARLSGISRISKDTALELIKDFRDAVRRIVSSGNSAHALFSQLRSKSTQPMRTERFIQKCTDGTLRFDDIGGIPMEACHLLGFAPKLLINHADCQKSEPGATL